MKANYALRHRFYTYIPESPPAYPEPRTFAILPHRNAPIATHFQPNRNTLASDEIQAHTGMFDSKTNDGYYELGLMTAQLIRDALNASTTRTEANQNSSHLAQADGYVDNADNATQRREL